LNLKFWKNKKVLITGSTGFKGSWLVLYLNLLGAKVYGLGLKNTNVINLHKQISADKYLIKEKIIDIRNKKKLKNYIQLVNPDIVFHLAAQSLVKKSYLKPELTLSTNIMGTVNLLEVSKNIKALKTIIVVTTDKVYENNEKKTFFKETDQLGGNDIYSASKSSVELVTNAYFESFFKNSNKKIATVRAGNVIGGGDWSADRIIPDLIRSIKKKNKLIIRSPDSVRPWQHVLEPLTGYILLAEKLFNIKKINFMKKLNFGPRPSSHISVRKIVNLLKKKLDNSSKYIINKSNLKEAKKIFLSSSNAEKYLNFKPTLNLQQTLNLTADWYKSYLNNKDLESKTIKQILHYIKKNSKDDIIKNKN
jgi:CDP-glucose 4,6-dehydratase